MEFTDFLTLEYITSFSGCVIITMLMVQLLKELPRIKNIPTKYFTFLIAFINILMPNIITGVFKIQDIYLIFINSMLITFTCTGGFDFATKKSINENKNTKE